MCFPALSDTHVDSAITHPDPVIWIGGILLDAAAIRCSRRHLDEFADWNYLDIPLHPGEINIPVVAQKRIIISVVVEKLLNDVVRPL